MPDLIDVEPRYVDNRDMRGWEAYVRRFFDRHVLSQLIPSAGHVVEMGTARGLNFSRLCDIFGADRCLGFDVVNYPNHERIRVADVRQLGREADLPIALGWNDVSSWGQSPESKRAAFDFLTRNVVEGGLYVDADFQWDTVASLDLSDYDVLVDHPMIKVWRRLRGGLALAGEMTAPGQLPAAWWQWLDRMQRIRPQPARFVSALGAHGAEDEGSPGPHAGHIGPALRPRLLRLFEGLRRVRGFESGFELRWWRAGPMPGRADVPMLLLELGQSGSRIAVGNDEWELGEGDLLFVPGGSLSRAGASSGRIVLALPSHSAGAEG